MVGTGVSVGRGVDVAVGMGVGVLRYGIADERFVNAPMPLSATT